MDLLLVLEDSSAIDPTNFMSIKLFLIKLLETFNVGQDGAHVALITFGEDAKLQFKFDKSYSMDEIQLAIDGVPYTGSPAAPRLDKALNLSTETVFSTAAGARKPDAQKILKVSCTLVVVLQHSL